MVLSNMMLQIVLPDCWNDPSGGDGGVGIGITAYAESAHNGDIGTGLWN